MFGLIWFLIVGLVAGLIASRLTGENHTLFENLIVGVIGAFLGAAVFWLIGLQATGIVALARRGDGGLDPASFPARPLRRQAVLIRGRPAPTPVSGRAKRASARRLSAYQVAMKTKPLAFSVHLLTGSGAALALMALVAATQGNWRLMFGWLGHRADRRRHRRAAGAQGRHQDATPRTGTASILDLVIDYLTYVFIPAYALIYSDLLPCALGADGGAAHRADRRRSISPTCG